MLSNNPFAEFEVKSFDDFESRYLNIQQNRTHLDAVYRGQSESSWELIPTIFRDDLNQTSLSFDWVKNRIGEEYLGVRYFAIMADRMGFDLPGELMKLLNVKNVDKFGFKSWYIISKNKYVEVICIAQHHGISTRFLDFTFDPYVALYFAAEGVIRKLLGEMEKADNSNDHFSLWMIDRMYLYNDENCRVKHFEVPTARNKYLNAQRGLFLRPPLPKLGSDKILKSNFDIKEVAIKNCYEIAKQGEGFKNIWPVIYKFNFHFNLAPEILRELDDRKGINITKLKPNLDNIIPYKNFRDSINNLWASLRNKRKN